VATICPSCGEENPERARFCLNCATPLGGEATHEERKLATVLFADLVGSTAMASDQDPERTRQVLNRFYDAMSQEVERYGGTVEKFAGDAVMAAFGAPDALEDHAERALHAGLAMHQRLAELFGGDMALRIGINTGEVLVGRPREGSSFVTGDVVNVAARLEQAARAGETLAGERTVTAASGAFDFGDPTTIEAKGKAGGIVTRRVLAALSLMRPRGLRGLPSVFVGREREFEQLQDSYRHVAGEGEPQLVSILGDAGVGKSRLTRELWSWLATQSPGPILRIGRTLSYGQGTTYWPLGEVLKEHFGISEGEAPEAIAAKLRDRPYLGLTLGLASAEDLHPLVARERLHDAWVEFLGELVTERSTVMLIEDAHWADDQLCDLIDTLVEQVSGPLLLLATARPEMLDRRPAWGGAWGRTSAIRLSALPPTDTSLLLDRLLEAAVPDDVSNLVVERAEGNPFFIEELIATFIDRGVLQRMNGSWTFADLPTQFTVPDSIQAVLAARIDLLPAAEKAALQAAAVIGRTFWSGPVYELVGGQHPDLGLLEEREFVRRRAGTSMPGEREYVIKHALTREVAYGTLPKATRAQLHAAFAGWLERRVAGRDELAPLLAHHYAEATRSGDVDLAWAGQDDAVQRLRASAVTWSRRAAELAVGRYEIDEGIALLHQAVELESQPSAQAGLWYEIGHASALKYDGEGFVAAMQKALELGADEGQVYSELAHQTMSRYGMWQRQLDNDLVEAWIARAVAATRKGSPARVKALAAKADWHNDLDAARAAVALADELGDAELRSTGLGAVQGLLEFTGQFEEAVEVAKARAQLLSLIPDPDHVAGALFSTFQLYANVGRLADARAVVERMEETVAGLTPHHRLHGAAMRMRLESAVGNWGAIQSLTQQTEDAVEANLLTPCPFNVGVLLIAGLGMVHGGDDGSAKRLVAKAEAIGMVGYHDLHAARWLNLAVARADHGEARRIMGSIAPTWLTPAAWELWAALFDGLAMLKERDRIESDAPVWVRPDAYVAPFAVRALGIARHDAALLIDALARFEAMGLDWHAHQTRLALNGLDGSTSTVLPG
jgi:class 3 adenylate cyclase